MSDPASGRDVRIDPIGWIGELSKLQADPLKDALKARMRRDEMELVRGDHFTGRLVIPTETEISPAGLLRLYERKVITKAQFVVCLSVRTKAAAEVLPGAELAKITTHTRGAPRLTPSRIQAVADPLAQAMIELAKLQLNTKLAELSA